MESLAIALDELTHFYGRIAAVDRISLQIPPGETFGLLGANGAGKSTAIKMLTTLLPPTGGSAKVLGFDIVKEASEVRKRIGYVPQASSVDADLTGYENLLISAKLYGMGRRLREERIEKMIQFMGLEQVADRVAGQYSGGMARRLEIGTALVHEPAVLFLDEPTEGLDPAAKKHLWDTIQTIKKYKTIILTTHDMHEAELLCDRVAFMQQGKIASLDSPAELKKKLGVRTFNEVFIQFMEGG